MKYLICTLLSFVCIFGFFTVTKAQIGSLPQTEIDIQLLPEIPRPNNTVSAFVNSYATNIDASKITWKVDDKIIKSGIGEKTFSFKVGDINTTTTLDVVIETTGGETIEKVYNIKPVSIDLIWEAGGFVPPFYKGKSLFSHQNKITFVAIPHITNSDGQEIEAGNLIYGWKKDGAAITSASGYGKNSFSFDSPLISLPFNIEVDVSSLDSSATGYASIDLTPSDPTILFYKKDPLYGIEFQNALQNTVTLGNLKEITVIGMPMFFGTTNLNAKELVYKWSINGASTNNDPTQPVEVFRQNGNTSGASNISLSVEDTNKILEYASNNFNLLFGNNNQ